ncbi:MAG: nitrogen regulation protein NR(II) [Nitrospiria bacterium]
MAMEEKKVTLLQEAFRSFNKTSFELEESYRLLEEQVRRLHHELEEKNLALKESQLEKALLQDEIERNHRLAAVGEMAVRMAHELRNPLGSIELFSSLLRKHLDADPEKREWAMHLSDAVTAMNYALSNLLLFTGKPTPHLRYVNLKKVIEGVQHFAAHLIEQNRVQYIQLIDNLPDLVWCDEDLIRQVLLNLALNAVDAMPQGGVLEVTADIIRLRDAAIQPADPDLKGEEKVFLTISDTGSGIPEEVLPKIFDPFYTTKEKGTGLGLAIAQNAIVAHQGIVRVQSKKGRGTRFTILFPLHEPNRSVDQEKG